MGWRGIDLLKAIALIVGIGCCGSIAPPRVVAQNNLLAQTQRQFATVSINRLETYRHPSGLFSLDVPVGWILEDTSKTDETIIAWTDPNRNSLVIIDVFESDNSRSPQELQPLLRNFINGLFNRQPRFQISDLPIQGDGSARVSWSYEVTIAGISGVLNGRSLIEQKGNKILVLSVAYPQTQETQLQGAFNQIITSRRLNPAISPLR